MAHVMVDEALNLGKDTQTLHRAIVSTVQGLWINPLFTNGHEIRHWTPSSLVHKYYPYKHYYPFNNVIHFNRRFKNLFSVDKLAN